MQKDPFKILNLAPDASRYQVEEAYRELKSKYSEDRFLEGQAGNDAAKKLTELETAYEEIQTILRQHEINDNYGSDYGEIEQLIKNGSLDLAQSKLDSLESRTGEWHYLQSIVYYKKKWYSESKKQLELAVSIDPSSSKYRDSLKRLNDLLNGPQPNQQGYNNQNGNFQQAPNGNQQQYYNQQQMDNESRQMGNCCCQLMICDMCCPLIDLNPCC